MCESLTISCWKGSCLTEPSVCVHHILMGTLLLPSVTFLVMLLIIADVLLASGVSQHLRKTRLLQKHSPGEGHMPAIKVSSPSASSQSFFLHQFHSRHSCPTCRMHSSSQCSRTNFPEGLLWRTASFPSEFTTLSFFPHTTYICRWFLVFAPRMFCFWISVLCLEQCSEIYSRWPLIC